MMIFNRAHFDHMTGADALLQSEIAALFRAQVDDWRAGASRMDRDSVHTLKGSARGIGFEALAAACEAAEAATGERAQTDALAQLLAALDQALAALEQV